MLTQTTKCGLFFLGGVALGALGAVVLTKGDLKVKPLASELLSGGIDLKDKLLASVEGVKEDLADVVAEAQVKSQERREAKEVADAAPKAAVKAKTTASPAPVRRLRLPLNFFRAVLMRRPIDKVRCGRLLSRRER